MKLAVLGGGGHCRSCIDVIRSAGLQIAGIVDPKPVSEIFGLPRLGSDDWLDSEEARGFSYLVTVGQIGVTPLRRNLFAALQARNLESATVFASSAIVSAQAGVGKGSIVMHRAVVNAGGAVGVNCIVNTGAIIEHDARIGDHCHISTGAIVNGDAEVGAGCMIGSGAVVLQGVKIAANVAVGAGAVVTRNVDAPGTWVGIPARRRA